MSKGLGKIERAVLAEFAWDPELDVHKRDWAIEAVFRPGADDPRFDDWEPTRAQVSTVNRAIRSLIRKELLFEKDWYPRGIGLGCRVPEARALADGKITLQDITSTIAAIVADVAGRANETTAGRA